MSKVIMKNTKYDLVVKIAHISGDGHEAGVVDFIDGTYGGLVPTGFDIKSIRWTQKSNSHIHIDHPTYKYVLCGNGILDFNKGMVDSSDSNHPIAWIHSDGTEFTLILELSKKY